MEAINRCVLIVKPKQPYLVWTNSVPDADVSPGTTLDSLRDDSSAYLLPEYETGDEEDDLLKEFWEEIFEAELNNWYTDRDIWPKRRTLEMFMEWFDVEFHSSPVDLVDDGVKKLGF